MISPHIWDEFVHRERCVGARRLDYPDWHRGRPRYYVWAISAEAATVEARLRRYRAALDGYLITPYPRQAHITMAVCGFLGAVTLRNDDVTPATVERQAQRLTALSLPPFAVEVGGANSFASAAFLEVADPGCALARIRQALAPSGEESRTTPYVPHITIGIYNDDHGIDQLVRAMEARHEDPLELTIDAVGFYSYDARSIGSPLRLEQRIDLKASG